MNKSSLQDKRVWLGGGCVAAVVILAAGWFLLVSPELSSAKQARSQAQTTQSQNQRLAANNAKLAAQFRGIASLRGSLAKAIAALPSTSGLPAFTQEVTRAAAAQSVKLTSIIVSAAAAVTPTTAPTTAATTAPTASSSAGDTAPTAAGTTSSAPSTGEFSFPITLTTLGTTPHQLAFLKALEDGSRSALVTSNQLTATGSNTASSTKSTTMATQLTIFSAPMSAAQRAQVESLLGLHR